MHACMHALIFSGQILQSRSFRADPSQQILQSRFFRADLPEQICQSRFARSDLPEQFCQSRHARAVLSQPFFSKQMYFLFKANLLKQICSDTLTTFLFSAFPMQFCLIDLSKQMLQRTCHTPNVSFVLFWQIPRTDLLEQLNQSRFIRVDLSRKIDHSRNV